MRVWLRYRDAGPNRVEPELFGDVGHAANEIRDVLQRLPETESAAALTAAAETLRDCCCRRPEGLCFITGEAGLIPRQDLHDRFEAALKTLHDAE